MLSSRSPTTRALAAEQLGQVGDSGAVGPLIRALDDARADVRIAAAEALGSFDDRRCIAPLASQLDAGDPALRAVSAEALGKTGRAEAVDLLLHALDDSVVEVRTAAAIGLGRIGGNTAVEPLIRHVSDRHAAGRAQAAQALGALGSREAVKPLIDLLQTGNNEEKHVAAVALGRIGDPSAIDALGATMRSMRPRLSDSSCSKVYDSATRALAQIAGSRAHYALAEVLRSNDVDGRASIVDALCGNTDSASIDVLRRAARDNDGVVAWAAQSALRNTPTATAARALLDAAGHAKGGLCWLAMGPRYSVEPAGADVLIRGLRDRNRNVRRCAADCLAWIDGPNSVEALAAVINDPDDYVRMYALKGLAWHGDRRAVEPILREFRKSGFGKGDDEIMVGALAETGDKRAVPWLMRATKEYYYLDGCVIQALGRIGDPSAMAYLIPLTKCKDWSTRDGAILAVAQIPDARCISLVLSLLHSKDPDTRYSAAAALGDTHSPRAVRPLVGASLNPNETPGVRCAAAKSLGRLGGRDAVSALAKALVSDPVPQVRRQAARSMIQLRSDQTADALISAILHDRGSGVRALAGEALSGLPCHRAASFCMQALKNKDYRILAVTFWYFIRQGVPDCESALIRAMLRHGDDWISKAFRMSGNSVLARAAEQWESDTGDGTGEAERTDESRQYPKQKMDMDDSWRYTDDIWPKWGSAR